MRKVWIGVAVTAMLALPFGLRPNALLAGGDFIVANDAQCQATECTKEDFKICSTFHADWIDFRCSKGCNAQD